MTNLKSLPIYIYIYIYSGNELIHGNKNSSHSVDPREHTAPMKICPGDAWWDPLALGLYRLVGKPENVLKAEQ